MYKDEFSWVQTHKELVEFLRTKENSQKELIQLLKDVGIGPFKDQSEPGKHDIELEEIDPFTFFCYIYKYGPEKRLHFLQEIAKKLNLTIPKGEAGIPSAQPQKVWLFPYKYLRTHNEVARLWKLFKKELSGQISDEDFADVLKIRSTGKTKLTEALFYINPEKYLPINGPTKSYIKEVLGIDPKFNTYSEYMALLSQIKEKTKIPFYELSYEAWKWNKMKNEVNYWIFQGNPESFDIEKALRENILSDWSVSAHKDEIKVGDKVIIWITGEKAGCYALAEVISEPYIKTTSPDNQLWKRKVKSPLKVDIKITHNLVDNPILKEEIEEVDELKNLNIGNPGTILSATEKEYQAILNLAKKHTERQYWLYSPGENGQMWDEFYEQGIMAIGWDKLGDLSKYKSREDIKNALVEAYGGTGSKKNDVSANYDFFKNIKIGDIVIAKKGRSVLLGYGVVTSDYIFDNSRSEYKHIRKVDWKLKGNWKVDFNLPIKTLTNITKYDSEHPDYDKYYERLLGIMRQNNSIEKNEEMNFPLNTILYGPPGTGKTYKTILRAAEIVENRRMDSYDEALEIFKLKLHDQIEFITFHQNYSYEDFIQGLRPDTENDKELTFEKKDGIFKVIADRALRNIKTAEHPSIVKKSFEESFNEFIKPLMEGEVEEIEVKMKKVSYFITGITNKSIEFRKSSGGTEHTLSISTLRKMYEAESVLDIQGLSSYYSPLLNELLKIGKDSTKKRKLFKERIMSLLLMKSTEQIFPGFSENLSH